MTKYLVAVEHPTGFDEENIVVTNDVEGFGPGLLAALAIQTVGADSPQQAAYYYARQHGLVNMLIIINLPSICEEWWMCTNEAHKVDTKVDTVWEHGNGTNLPGESKEAVTIEIPPSALETSLYFAKRLRKLNEGIDIAKWFELSQIDKERDNAYWVLGSTLAELLEDAGLVPPESGEERSSTAETNKVMHVIERKRRIQNHTF